MFFAKELQISRIYIFFDPQGIFKPPKTVICACNIALHFEQVML